jgi:DNA mismatch endonuclease, patch repair protein
MDAATRSALMSRIQARNTRPVRAPCSVLPVGSERYGRYAKVAGNTVDFLLPDRGLVVLVHGYFWHGCARHLSSPLEQRRILAMGTEGESLT